jgi:hypothetical protein
MGPGGLCGAGWEGAPAWTACSREPTGSQSPNSSFIYYNPVPVARHRVIYDFQSTKFNQIAQACSTGLGDRDDSAGSTDYIMPKYRVPLAP